MQKTHQMALQVTHKIEQMIQSNHQSSERVRSIGDNVSTRWQQLMFHAEERIKLVLASTNWFKTADQVRLCDVLRNPVQLVNPYILELSDDDGCPS